MKLGRIEQVKIQVVDDEGHGAVVFHYRSPNAAAHLAFRSVMAEVMPEIKTGPTGDTLSSVAALRLAEGWRELALACITRVEGIEDLDGNPLETKEAIEALRDSGEGHTLLEALGQHVFNGMRKLEAETGKGERASG